MASYIKRLIGWQRKGAAPVTQSIGGYGTTPYGQNYGN